MREGICHESAQAQPVKDALWASTVDQGRTALGGGYHSQHFRVTQWRWICILGRSFREAGRGCIYEGTQFAAAVREPQVCCGSSVVSKVTPLLTQVLPDL